MIRRLLRWLRWSRTDTRADLNDAVTENRKATRRLRDEASRTTDETLGGVGRTLDRAVVDLRSAAAARRGENGTGC